MFTTLYAALIQRIIFPQKNDEGFQTGAYQCTENKTKMLLAKKCIIVGHDCCNGNNDSNSMQEKNRTHLKVVACSFVFHCR